MVDGLNSGDRSKSKVSETENGSSTLPLKSLVVADMGCGDAKIAQSLHAVAKIHSFDLVAKNAWVTGTNIANTPLASSSVDVVVFCLSLMGTDFLEFVVEAHRILKLGYA
jgi:hypothetical protein